MKNLLTVSIFITGILFFTSCKRENSDLMPRDEEIAAAKSSKPITPIRVKTETDGFGTKTYFYNIDLNSVGFTGYQNATYSYPDALHIIANEPYYPETQFDLNKKGLIEKGTNLNGITYYLYNTKNQLIERFIQSGSDIDDMTYIYNKDGNLDSIKTVSNGADASVQTFTYYTDKLNLLDHEAFGEAFRGAESKNLMKSTTVHYFNGFESTTDKTYTVDAMGRVTKVSTTTDGKSMPDVSYTYY
jgi:hypothetical protein